MDGMSPPSNRTGFRRDTTTTAHRPGSRQSNGSSLRDWSARSRRAGPGMVDNGCCLREQPFVRNADLEQVTVAAPGHAAVPGGASALAGTVALAGTAVLDNGSGPGLACRRHGDLARALSRTAADEPHDHGH